MVPHEHAIVHGATTVKRTLISVCTAAFVLLLSGCPGGASVRTDYDHTANFAQFKTFSFGQVKTDNPLFEQRIRDEVSKDLQSKGLQMAQGNGDLVVTAVGASHNRSEYQTFYNNPGFGYYWGGFGPGLGTSTTTVQHYRVGTLVLDLYNSQNKRLVWRGIAKSGLSNHADTNTERVNAAIDKMLDDYPRG